MSEDRSLLAHLVPKLTRGVEDAATDALAFILNKSAACMSKLGEMVSADGRQLAPLRQAKTQVTVSDRSRLDLVGYDRADSMRLIIESKFWAPLQDEQAPRYVRHLSCDGPAMLLFVAPLARHETLWVKIERQFQEESDLGLGPRRDIDKLWIAEVDESETDCEAQGDAENCADSEKYVALMSWEALLAGLAHADTSVDGDIEQVRSLAAQQDQAAFTPLHPEELVASIPRRIMSFCDLVDGAVNRGKRDDWLTTKDMKRVNQRDSYTRFAGFLDANASMLIGLALRVDMDQWARSGASPIWLRIWHQQQINGRPIDLDELGTRWNTAGWLPCRREPDWLWIPIELTTGLEYEDVLDEATRQVKRVRDITEQLAN